MRIVINCSSSLVVQNRISAMWFKGKELAFAFGCILAFSRLVSVPILKPLIDCKQSFYFPQILCASGNEEIMQNRGKNERGLGENASRGLRRPHSPTRQLLERKRLLAV